MTVTEPNHVGVKRKRNIRDDGFRVPIIQQSYFLDETVPLPGARGSKHASLSAYPARQTSVGPTYPYNVLVDRQTSSTPDRYAFTTPGREQLTSSVHSAARMEYRAMTSSHRERKRESSTYSSRSCLGGKEGSVKSWDEQSKSTTIPLSRRFPSTSRSSLTPSRSELKGSLLPAHLRPATSDQDSLSAERYASSLRLLATWESIALKYADVDPEDDAEIDISTGRIVRGKEKIAEMPDRVIGGMSEDEEAEELGKRRKSAKNAKLETSAFQLPDPAEQVMHPVESLSIDADESDPSDMDELDAWNDSELEIQVEALPPSYTSKARNQRPWTADDDVDLQEFLKAEERRRAMFGAEEAAEDIAEEEESRLQVSRTMDKEEAMSRRTVHASVPYFPPAPSDYPSRSKHRSKEAASDPSSTGFFARPSSRRDPLPRVNVDSVADDSDTEDELAAMLATPERLEEKELSCRDVAPSTSPSLRVPDIQGTLTFRHSSPSSASSYLNRQSTEGLSSSGEGEIYRTYRPHEGGFRRLALNDEDICERELLDSSSGLRSPEHESDSEHSHFQLLKNPHTPSGKATAQEDEARCSPENLVEVVIEVPVCSRSESVARSSLSEIAEAEVEQPRDIDPVSSLRRSSRQGASGKSYALRNKRKRRIRPTAHSSTVDHSEVYAEADEACDEHSALKTYPPLPSPPAILQAGFEEGCTNRKIPFSTPQKGNRDRRQDARARSLSVVEGTPSVIEGTPEPMFDEVWSAEGVGFDFQCSNKNGREGTIIGKQMRKEDVDQPKPAQQTAVRLRPDAVQETGDIGDEAGSAQQIPPSTSLLPKFFGSEPTSPALSVMVDDLSDKSLLPQEPLFQEIQDPENARPTQQTPLPGAEDEEDILLLGATFVESEEVIWAESKPDISLSSPAEDPPDLWSGTPCEMTFKTVKGEKQEMSTFTAPFRCSKIIDLTGDDICGDDEHDELDEW